MKNFKCLLIHTPRLKNINNTIISDINYCAMGLFSLAGELAKNGFDDTKILNLSLEKYLDKDFLLSEYIQKNNIKFVAFTLQWCHQSYDVIETSRIIKEKCPDIYIMLGGFTASFFAEDIMQEFSYIDFIIKGDGELPIVQLTKALSENKSLDNIPNLYHRKGNKIILNKEVFVASSEDLNSYEFYNAERMIHYDEYSKMPYDLDFSKENQLTNISSCINILLGRGCLGNCIWCGGGFYSGKLVSRRSFIAYRDIHKVISEMKIMYNNFNIDTFRFGFDPNNNDRSYFIALFKAIKNEFNNKLTIMYDMEGLPDKKLLDVFKESVSSDSILSITPTCYSEDLRKIYRSFYFSNKELEDILEYMDYLEIKSEIYFSRIPGIDSSENVKSEEYGKRLKEKFKYITFSYIFDLEIVPASLWTFNTEKYNLPKDIKKNFKDYYNFTKGIKNSFENTELFNNKKGD